MVWKTTYHPIKNPSYVKDFYKKALVVLIHINIVGRTVNLAIMFDVSAKLQQRHLAC